MVLAPRGRPIERLYDGFLPGAVAIDAFGQGGFRFGGMSHKGSIIALPSGVRAWDAVTMADVAEASLAAVFSESPAITFLLLGCGTTGQRLPDSVVWALSAARIVVETMTTGAAVRTYNVLLAEGRPVGAALLAVDS